MVNMGLKSVPLPCDNCGRTVNIRSKGLCPACRYRQRGKDKSPTTKRESKRRCLKKYFESHVESLGKHPYSELSGKYINTPSALNIAHIFPKRSGGGFPSVMCHSDNFVYLTWEEHTRFDELLDSNRMDELRDEFSEILPLLRGRISRILPEVEESGSMLDRVLSI
jgi:hypothetical protein